MPYNPVIRSTIRRLFEVNTSQSSLSTTCILLAAFLSLSSTMANNNVKAVIKGNNQLTNRLYFEVSTENENDNITENIIFSPLSLHMILSLVYQGSKGDTEAAFKRVLNVPDKARTADGYETLMQQLQNVENVTLDIANKVYIKEGYKMKDSFKQIATKQFKAGAENIDFDKTEAAAATINSWVEDKTRNKIKDLIESSDLDDLSRLVLINAIYFKGNWADQFKKELTRPDKFYISENDTVPCEMMFRNGKYNYKDDTSLDAQVIQLPYKNPALSMVIVLPTTKTGISALEKKLVSYDLTTLTENMRNVEVDLSLPKFKIESEICFNGALKNMGLAVAFNDNANFSELLQTDEPLKISKVIQKAFIEVNEEGAEAAAATGVLVRNKRCLADKETFDANKAFVYYIVQSRFELSCETSFDYHGDWSNCADGLAILFHGKLTLPTIFDIDVTMEHEEL